MTRFVLIFVASFGLFINTACSSSIPQREISNPQKPVVYEPAPIKELSREEIRDELLTLESEISGLDLLIASARARRAHYKTVGLSRETPSVMGTQYEILNYEFQKRELEQKKEELLSQLSDQ